MYFVNIDSFGLSFKWQEVALKFCCTIQLLLYKVLQSFFAFSFVFHARSLPPLPPLAAGHITSMEELGAYFSSAFGSDPHTVLLFLQAKVGLQGSSGHY